MSLALERPPLKKSKSGSKAPREPETQEQKELKAASKNVDKKERQ